MHGRSAATDVATGIMKVLASVVNEANDHLVALQHHEPEVATVNPQDQPQFMHNLMFRLAIKTRFLFILTLYSMRKTKFHPFFVTKLETFRIDVSLIQLNKNSCFISNLHFTLTKTYEKIFPQKNNRNGHCFSI